MKNKNSFTLLLLVVIPLFLKAQFDDNSISSGCFTDQLHQKMLNGNPDYANKHQVIEQQIYDLQNQTTAAFGGSPTTDVISVVVHIIHQNGAENIAAVSYTHLTLPTTPYV